MSEPRRWKDPQSDAPADVQALLRSHRAQATRTPRPSWERGVRRGFDKRWVIAATAFAALALWFVAGSKQTPTPAPLTGVVAQGILTLDGQKLAQSDRLTLPTTVQTTDRAAVVRLTNGDRITMSADGEFALKDIPECSPCLFVHRGVAALDVEHRRADAAPFVVHAAPWRVVVLGTRFSVSRHPPRDVRVDVERGVVRVIGPSQSRELGAGQFFDSRQPTEAATQTALQNKPQEVVVQQKRPPARQSSSRTKKAVPAPQHRSAVEDNQQTNPPGRPRVDEVEPASEPRKTKRSRDVGRGSDVGPNRDLEASSSIDRTSQGGRSADRNDGLNSTDQRPIPTEPLVTTPVVNSRDKATPVRDQQLTLLSTARQSKDSAAAVRALDAAAAMGPPFAEVASYRAAQLRLKDRAFDDASDRFRRHIRKWPSGELSDVAHLDLIESDLRRGDTKAASVHLQQTLRNFPNLGSAAPLQFLRAEIARANKNWAEAAIDYERAARVKEYAPRALFLEALSHARSGHRQVARTKMKSYLERFPDGVFAQEAKKALGNDMQSERP